MDVWFALYVLNSVCVSDIYLYMYVVRIFELGDDDLYY